ncbi:Acyl-coenzyme A thioesterase 13 [Aphelenchoides besseyi]|nr:Acyl-coenzyme A thioesterase 13 [Aphelenchoides besseyi]
MASNNPVSEPVNWMERLKENIEDMVSSKNYGRYAKNLKPLVAEEKRVVLEFEVTEELINGKGTLHGGQTSLLVDIATALAITLTVRDVPLVSVELACSYLQPALLGERITVEAECLKIGRNIIFTNATFRKANGSVVAAGKHTLGTFPRAEGVSYSTARLNHLRNENGAFVRQ